MNAGNNRQILVGSSSTPFSLDAMGNLFTPYNGQSLCTDARLNFETRQADNTIPAFVVHATCDVDGDGNHIVCDVPLPGAVLQCTSLVAGARTQTPVNDTVFAVGNTELYDTDPAFALPNGYTAVELVASAC